VKRLATIFLMLISMAWPIGVSAGAMENFHEARMIYMAAGACMAAYDTRHREMAITAIEQEGWQGAVYKQDGDKANVKYLLARDIDSGLGRVHYVLAMAGTESFRDIKVDLRARKVYFAGSTLEEFLVNAQRDDVPPDAPRVHQGFNQAAQILLSEEATLAADEKAGEIRRLSDSLKEGKIDKIYLFGHSQGGAIVTLFGARLFDMGIRPEQIEIITFGAPGVGNEYFQKKYDGKFSVTRFVVPGDLIPRALRRVFGGYRHIGKEVNWTAPATLENYFYHDIYVYLDLALKNYYLMRRQAMNEGLLPRSEPIGGKHRLYVASIINSLSPALTAEFPFMAEGLWEEYDRIVPGAVFESGEESNLSLLEKAAAAGCTLLVVPEISAHLAKNEDPAFYYVSLIQTVYRVSDGQLVDAAIFGASTKELTPLLALILGARSLAADGPAWAKSN
jgi:pimeloyl-ACP methyl ester carboxylesterase